MPGTALLHPGVIMLKRLTRTLLAVATCGGLLGAASPTVTVERWKVPAIDSPMWESHPAIDPLTGDLWFVRGNKDFSGWRIKVSRCVGGKWSAPADSPIAAPGLEADPWFTPDGKTLYYISTRATGEMKSAAFDIWVAHRDTNGTWAKPERLPAPVNSDAAEWYPRLAPDGWLYFGSRRNEGLGKDDIWRARQVDGKWTLENAGPGLNTAAAEYEFLPSADGKWGVIATDSGIFHVSHGPSGWKRDYRYGPEINANTTEIGALLSPSGQSMVFSRDIGEPDSGVLFVAHLSGHEIWPTECAMPTEAHAAP